MTVTTDQRARPSWLGAEPRAAILFNAKSGSVQAADLDKLVACARENGIAHADVMEIDELESLFERAAGADVVIVLGGDGTARAAAALAPKNAPPLILLPGGTLNLLARVLYGELAWPDALAAALTRGEKRLLTTGLANGEPFFIAAMFGAPTLLARAREAVREGKLLAALRRLRHFTKRAFSRKISGRPDGARMRRAEGIGVLCPSYSGALEGDSLEWVRLDAANMFDLMRVSVKSLVAGWRADPAIDARSCAKGEVRGRGIIPGTLDGEPRTFLSRVRITMKAKGPCVIALPEEPAA